MKTYVQLIAVIVLNAVIECDDSLPGEIFLDTLNGIR